ncbi:MAG: aminotransferase class IV [Phycisphaerae bacterium]
MASNSVFLNGLLVPAEQASVSVFDAGFLHGASAFTTMLAHNGAVFRLARHLERLMDTVRLLGLRSSATSESLAAACREVLEANGLTEARMRITLTAGSIRGGVPGTRNAASGESGQPTTLVTAEPMGDLPRQWYEKGISVVVSSLKQCGGEPTFGYKTGCYLPRLLARQEAAAKGAEEALWFTTDNRLAEACFNNVFLVHDGAVRTPPLDTPVLPGIVRGAVIELCGAMGLACDDETPLTVKEMLGAQEMFLTGSTSGVRPVVRVERHAVGDEKPGPVTRKIMAAYRELLDRECPAPSRG